MNKKSEIFAGVRELVQRARMENRLLVRAKRRVSQHGVRAFNNFDFNIQSLVMPSFVRDNLMKAARRLRATI